MCIHRNGRYFVYATRVDDRSVVALGDRQQQTVQVTDSGAYNPFGHLVEFNVHWSQDNSRFIVSNDLFNATVYRLGTNYTNDIAGLVFERVDEWVDADPILTRYVLSHVYDISDDGNSLLITLYPDTAQPNRPTLFAVMSLDPAVSSDIIEGVSLEGVIAAAFSVDNSYFTFINRTGIHQYDRATQISITLSTELTTVWVDLAAFSPDRTSLAFVTPLNDIYVVTLSSIPPFPTRIPSHTPAPTP